MSTVTARTLRHLETGESCRLGSDYCRILRYSDLSSLGCFPCKAALHCLTTTILSVFLDPDACIWFIGRRTVKSVEPLILGRSIPKVRFVFYEHLLYLEISSYLLVNL